MNERDLKLVGDIATLIEPNGAPAVYVLTTKYTNLVRINLVLLKAFLDMKRRKGMMITIDRPHQYISHLLQLHGIDQGGLVFIDAISNHASDTKAGAPAAAALESGPFYIETLPDFIISCDGRDPGHQMNLASTEFILMDNISTLLTYNSMDSVKKFFSRYVGVLRERSLTSLATLLVMDKDLHADLYSFIAPFAKKVIEVSADMSIGSVESRSSSNSSDSPSQEKAMASNGPPSPEMTGDKTGEMK